MNKICVRFTDICNMQCPWCIVEDSKLDKIPMWGYDVKQKFFTTVESLNPYQLDIVGGEPLLFPEEVYSIAKRAREINPNMGITVYTNGTCFTPSMVETINKLNIGVCASFSEHGYKGLANIQQLSSYPVDLFNSINKRTITNVISPDKPFAKDIIAIHSKFNCPVFISPDYTNLKLLKNENVFNNFKQELSKLGKDSWWEVNLFMNHFCDCEQASTTFHANGEIIAPKCLAYTGKAYGCYALDVILGKKLHNQYTVMINTMRGDYNGRNIQSCSVS